MGRVSERCEGKGGIKGKTGKQKGADAIRPETEGRFHSLEYQVQTLASMITRRASIVCLPVGGLVAGEEVRQETRMVYFHISTLRRSLQQIGESIISNLLGD